MSRVVGTTYLAEKERGSYRLRRDMETDEERQSRLTANIVKIL